MAWEAGTLSAQANDPARGTSGCVDDTWAATSTVDAPGPRSGHTAIWTDSEIIVWGGFGGGWLNTGGRYDPATDSWTATSTEGAPSAAQDHTAVWTGTEMIVWGGEGSGGYRVNSGGRYDPATDSWTATSTEGAPSARDNHTAVWTGKEMLVWGGYGYPGCPGFGFCNTGGRYDPATDTWTTISTEGAPSPRSGHTAVWNGTEMIVWGGAFIGTDRVRVFHNTGGRYDPVTDTWTATTLAGAPIGRWQHTAVWTGSEMIVWSGVTSCDDVCHVTNTGGRYDPATDTWTATSLAGASSVRRLPTAVWTGQEMLVWGGEGRGSFFPVNTGGRYDPVTDTWTATSLDGAPSGRCKHTAVWTGTEMIVLGGYDFRSRLDTGGRYCAR